MGWEEVRVRAITGDFIAVFIGCVPIQVFGFRFKVSADRSRGEIQEMTEHIPSSTERGFPSRRNSNRDTSPQLGPTWRFNWHPKCCPQHSIRRFLKVHTIRYFTTNPSIITTFIWIGIQKEETVNPGISNSCLSFWLSSLDQNDGLLRIQN